MQCIYCGFVYKDARLVCEAVLDSLGDADMVGSLSFCLFTVHGTAFECTVFIYLVFVRPVIFL